MVGQDIAETQCPLFESDIGLDIRLDMERRPRQFGVVRPDGNGLQDAVTIGSGAKRYFDFSFPTRGNIRPRKDGRGASSRCVRVE